MRGLKTRPKDLKEGVLSKDCDIIHLSQKPFYLMASSKERCNNPHQIYKKDRSN